jgi:hypothetical protein
VLKQQAEDEKESELVAWLRVHFGLTRLKSPQKADFLLSGFSLHSISFITVIRMPWMHISLEQITPPEKVITRSIFPAIFAVQRN